MMRVISEQKKSLYLKAYVGSVYKDGVWRKMPEGQDPLQWFLTTSRTGNQMLYASAAVEAFRAHGIPARYVEGYYLGASKIQDSKNGEVSITGENASATVKDVCSVIAPSNDQDGVAFLIEDILEQNELAARVRRSFFWH